MNQLADGELLRLLKGVSRSFYLTIRALPRGLRRPIGLAYLLARASDTIADTATAPQESRTECLHAFVARLQRDQSDIFARLHQINPPNPYEQYLLGALERVIAAVDQLPDGDRAEILTLLQKITHGQELDLLRFPDPTVLHALDTPADLDQYTYLVAGCVGEFWTRICAAHLPSYSRLPLDQLSALGRAFGQGLQLVNILRDLPEDIANGRCYLPMSDLQAAGIGNITGLPQNLPSAAPVFEAWRQQALHHLEQGRGYIQAIHPWRIRFGCLLPWAIGVRTLTLIAESSPLQHPQRIKVSRNEVSRIIRRALWASLSNTSVRNWAPED
jgi:farnesyl-diphosphate farnesyltransferase